MSRPKLTYFDFSGSRGEECRIALHLAGVDFEDHRIKRPQWLELKPKTPFGGLPIFEMNDKPPLGQSIPILTFIGRGHGMHPSDPWEAARHEAVMHAVEDLRTAMTPLGSIEDEEEKKTARQKFVAGYLRTWAERIERQIEAPFLSGTDIHVADIKLFMITQSFVSGVYDHVPTDCLDDFPKLIALHKTVSEHPKVAQWRSQ